MNGAGYALADVAGMVDGTWRLNGTLFRATGNRVGFDGP
jgi:hypothetical protein